MGEHVAVSMCEGREEFDAGVLVGVEPIGVPHAPSASVVEQESGGGFEQVGVLLRGPLAEALSKHPIW